MELHVIDCKTLKDTQAEVKTPLFDGEVNESLVAQAVRVYLSRQRQGNAHTKNRSEVTGSTRKIYKQKGTGRARHGDIRAPIFVGGGIVHGPRAHDYSLTLPIKMKKQALLSALAAKKDVVWVADNLVGGIAKTKDVSKLLEKVGGKKVLFVLSSSDAIKSLRNIDGIDYIQASDLHTYAVLSNKSLVVDRDALAQLEKRLIG